jgi:Arc/MetJ-type ribon-helix-helix transcriptional regulator
MAKPRSSSVVTFTVPPDLKDILDVAGDLGFYDSLSEFLRDAVRNHIQENPALGALIAFHLVKAKRISIGKATLLTNASLEETKEMIKALEC